MHGSDGQRTLHIADPTLDMNLFLVFRQNLCRGVFLLGQVRLDHESAVQFLLASESRLVNVPLKLEATLALAEFLVEHLSDMVSPAC